MKDLACRFELKSGEGVPKRQRIDLANIPTEEALDRLAKVEAKIEDDVRKALWAEAVLEAGNDLIHSLEDKAIPGAHAYNIIKKALETYLVMALSRLYDRDSDVASILALITLVKRQDVRERLLGDARSWRGAAANQNARHCTEAIERLIAVYSNLAGGDAYLLRDLRDFRDSWVAHNLIDIKGTPPQYHHLSRLVYISAKLAEAAKLAIYGNNIDYAERRDFNREAADDFWKSALRTTYVINQELMPITGPISGTAK
jgi:hypothetical protein